MDLGPNPASAPYFLSTGSVAWGSGFHLSSRGFQSSVMGGSMRDSLLESLRLQGMLSVLSRVGVPSRTGIGVWCPEGAVMACVLVLS